VEAHPRIVVRCIDVIFFRPKGHSVRDKYFVLLNMASVYHIVAIRVNETSWAHVWRLHFRYLGTGYDTSIAAEVGGDPIVVVEVALVTC
jgi:predicted metalloenzyme YecM